MNPFDTRQQLLAEIAEKPEESTLRLAFADWLDEQPATKTCPTCRGTGEGVKTGTYSWKVCDCTGTGTVPDTADADRAEFIRVQCEWSSWERPGGLFEVPPTASGKKRLKWCLDRQDEFLDAHPEWARCRCPKCNGRKGRFAKTHGGYEDEWIDCGTCDGTGDLFLGFGVSGASKTPPPKPRTVTFARGFADSVTCTLAEAFGTDGTPTPWAVAVVRQTPVMRFRVTDQTPHHRDAAIRGPFAVGLVWDWSSASTPEFLMDEMAAAHPDKFADTPGGDVWWMEFETEADAIDALALSAGRLVRRHAYKDRT